MKKKKFLTIFLSSILLNVSGQTKETPPINWQNLDLKKDGVFGISMEKAYQELLVNKTHKSVVVAIIDGGVDVRHEDLKSIIWINPEDETQGRNFYSTMTKGDEEFDIAELIRQLKKYVPDIIHEDSSKIPKENSAAYLKYKTLRQSLALKLQPLYNKLNSIKSDQTALENMLLKINKSNPTIDDFKNYIPANQEEAQLQKDIVRGLKMSQNYVFYKRSNLNRALQHYKMELAFHQNQDYSLITGGPSSYHGTHIAGIIAADRNNQTGIMGVANDVRIMVIRAIAGINPTEEGITEPTLTQFVGVEGNDQDRVIALSIRYAADHGAKIINMSFGQRWTFNSIPLMEAFKYAASKDVLIVHATGNQGKDLDQFSVNSKKTGAENIIADCWIEVSASGWKDDNSLAAKFANYGKHSVDVYAPGVEILSTAPRSAYMSDTGTSMAAPVVSGLAAVIRAYYPKLKAKEVKDIIMKSVTKTNILENKCISGGVVNAYKALKMAENLR